MCGIAVELSADAGRPGADRVSAMLAAIRHRGDSVHYGRTRSVPGAVLGSNRLAIVARDEADQPMPDADGGLWVVFNGEIYNHPELRRELTGLGHGFRTGSDTEVLLRGYREWGEDLPSRLDGVFAFLIYDPATRDYLCARDRFGVKPLYRAGDGETTLFASELKAFGTTGCPPLEFPPGHTESRAGRRRYDERRAVPVPEEEDEVVAELFGRLDDAVAKRVRTDLPVGVIYSGGVDSAAVLGLAIRHHPDVTAISVGFPGAPDLEFAIRSCADLGVRHVVHHLDHDVLAARLPETVRQIETFEVIDIMDASVMTPAFAVARELGLKVVLVGDGSDELFAGYELFRDHPDPVAMSRYRVMNLYRTDLQRVDRTSMLHSVEARVPFLDPSVVDLAWHLPMSWKFRDGIEKWVLRRAIEGVVPDYLAWRPKIRMPQGTGLLFQLIEYARGQAGQSGSAGSELADRIGLDRPEARYFLRQYLDHGYPTPTAAYRRAGWDFAPNGYFVFGDPSS
ncbi:asparagine synthetase B family protein [Actinophytocola oryzae]|uniref:asparagine synthase (glutamine-hydrolyzing) n=1 Tax=Actinophytocola oryzae TaxID=502181 RepID=A0A4R7W1V1_9PSEU|nr:asparagine synthase-related protein [Actinophytocola oryzae]TDV56402.1 asparagine synthase (glutamine-hydrolysing) [Actinophytocola oryzae]